MVKAVLPMQGMQIQSLVRDKGPKCPGAIKIKKKNTIKMSRHVSKYITCNPITFTVLKYSCKFSMNSGFPPTGLSKKLSFLRWENSCGAHHTAGNVPGAGDTSGRDSKLLSLSDSRSVVSDSATPWTIQSMGFSRPGYWSG